MTASPQLGYELRLAELAWRRNLEGPLRELGLTIPQYSTLRALERAPGASSAELARTALVTPQTMNALVLQLEELELLTRTANTANLRVLNAELTPAGRSLLTKATRLVRRLESVAVSDLSETEHQQLLQLLTRCTAALDRDAPRAVHLTPARDGPSAAAQRDTGTRCARAANHSCPPSSDVAYPWVRLRSVPRELADDATVDVLIAGGGPFGLMLANELGRRGVSVALL